MGKKKSRIVWDLLELAVGAKSRADSAQLHVNDIVHAAVRHGATWGQVGKWLNLSPDEAKERYANADGSITLDEDVVIQLGYIAKINGLDTFSGALRLVIDQIPDDSSRVSTSGPGRDDVSDGR